MEQLFIKAIKKGFRFPSTKGMLSLEDLYNLPLQAKENQASLDSVARIIYNQVKESSEVSFVSPTKSNTELNEKLEIVKFIIKDKQEDAKAASEKAEKIAERARLKLIKAEKIREKEGELSLEEIEMRIAELD